MTDAVATQTGARSPGAHGTRPRSYLLRPVGSPDGGIQILVGRTVLIGQDPVNDLQITHSSVAPFHCRVVGDRHGLMVESVRQQRVRVDGVDVVGQRPLQPGQLLQVGAAVLELVPEDDSGPSFQSLLLQDALRLCRSVPWYTLSVMVHVLIWLMLQHWTWMDQDEENAASLQASLMAEDEDLLEVEPLPFDTMDTEEPDLLESPELPLDDPRTPGDPDSLAPLPLAPSESLSPFGMGLSAPTGRGLMGGMALRLNTGGSEGNGLVPFLQDVRKSGMDVVFLVDTTSSMEPFLAQARQVIDQTITQLAALVQDLRIGMVAFRDKGDDYVTRELALSDDRYEILGFLNRLEAEGGNDIPEAIADGLEAAMDMHWRDGAYRVVVLVGDAPPHRQDWPRLRSAIARFRKSDDCPSAVLSTVFTGADRMRRSGQASEAAQALGEMARLGDGDYLDLSSEETVGTRLLVVTLGREHEEQLGTLLAKARRGAREALIEERRVAGDLDWLLGKMQRVPVHPDVVNALIELADRRVLSSMAETLLDESRPQVVRKAALHVISTVLGRPVPIDLDVPISRQRKEVRWMWDWLQRY